VLLVAESHVGEMPGDTGVRLSVPRAVKTKDLPDSYVRLIYCLGYGDEDRICRPTPVPNEGTDDFWNIFSLIATGAPTPAGLSSRPGGVTAWRVSILEALRDRGIWLEDASPLGLYRPDGRTPTTRLRPHIFRDSYRRFIWPAVEHERPEQVWVIGHSVHTALSSARLPAITAEHRTWQPRGAARGGKTQEYNDERLPGSSWNFDGDPTWFGDGLEGNESGGGRGISGPLGVGGEVVAFDRDDEAGEV
jgi:hypothetical protein